MKKTVSVVILAAALLTVLISDAGAFPGWMGVYGGVVRHDDSRNPGEFTVLMNDDYYGLSASVGMRVNGGHWRSFDMHYAGKNDVNSVWTFTPDFEFPPGAKVEYFFKGWDGTGAVIYDNIPGNDYNFYAANTPGMTIPVYDDLGVVSNEYISYAIGGAYKTVVQEKDQEPGTWRIVVSFKRPGEAWEVVGVPYESTSSIIGLLGVMVKDDTILISASDADPVLNKDRPRLHRSVDGGRTWLAPLDGYYLLHKLKIHGDELLSFNDDGTLQRMPMNGTQWSDPVVVLSKAPSSLALSDSAMIVCDGYQGSVSISFDDGYTWNMTSPSDLQQIDAMYAVDGKVYLVGGGSDPSFPGMRVWSRSAVDTSWNRWAEPLKEIPTYDIRHNRLQVLPDDQLVFFYEKSARVNDEMHYFFSYQISSDRGQTWSKHRDGRILEGYSNLNYIGTPRRVSDDVFLLTASITIDDSQYNRVNQYFSGITRFSDSLDERLFWAGDVYHWPMNDVISKDDDLWINASVWPADRALNVYANVAISGPNVQSRMESIPMEQHMMDGDKGVWHVNLGKLPENTTIAYSVIASDRVGAKILENIVGKERVVRSSPTPIYWMGNVIGVKALTDKYHNKYHEIKMETWPRGGAVAAAVVDSWDGVNWTFRPMSKEDIGGNNDHWRFGGTDWPGSSHQCAIWVLDGTGQEWWLTNNGLNYWLFQ